MSPNLGKKLFPLVSSRYTAEKSAGNKVRVLIRTLLLIVVPLWLLSGVACTSDTASTRDPTAMGAPQLSADLPESRVSAALGSVPLEFSGQVVEFADYSRSRALNGLEEVDSSEDLYRLDRKGWQRLFDGVRLHPHLKSRIQRMLDLMAVDVFAFDQSVWSWRDGSSSPTFMLVQVPFDPENVAGKLQALDYKEADYAGTAYYWLHEDFAPGFGRPLGLPLNRVAFLEGRLAAAPSTGIIEQLIDVHHGESPSLLESEPH